MMKWTGTVTTTITTMITGDDFVYLVTQALLYRCSIE